MAGHADSTNPQYPDSFESYVSGPYAATQADVNLDVPIFNVPVAVKRVTLIATTKPSVGSNFNIFRQEAARTVANAVSDAFNVITQVDLNAALTDLVAYTATVETDENVLMPGERLVADFATTTSMAGFYISVQIKKLTPNY